MRPDIRVLLGIKEAGLSTEMTIKHCFPFTWHKITRALLEILDSGTTRIWIGLR